MHPKQFLWGKEKYSPVTLGLSNKNTYRYHLYGMHLLVDFRCDWLTFRHQQQHGQVVPTQLGFLLTCFERRLHYRHNQGRASFQPTRQCQPWFSQYPEGGNIEQNPEDGNPKWSQRSTISGSLSRAAVPHPSHWHDCSSENWRLRRPAARPLHQKLCDVHPTLPPTQRRPAPFRFTRDVLSAIQLRWKFHLAVIPLLAIRSQQFLHIARQHTCHMQNFVTITIYIITKFPSNLNCAMEQNVNWNGPQLQGVEATKGLPHPIWMHLSAHKGTSSQGLYCFMFLLARHLADILRYLA